MPDSMGNPIGKIDSIFIMVIGPSGDSVKAEKIAGIAAGTNWTSYIKRGAAIGWDSLTFIKCQVSNIVVTGSPGVYTVIIQGYAAAGGSTAKRARYAYQFQYVKATLSQTLYAVLDTLLRPTVKGRTLDVASTGEAGMDFSNINGTLDSSEVGATLGSFIANHSDSANNKLTYDSIKVYDNWIRDSVHNQSVAVLASAASAANLTKVIDTVNGILDTLQLYDNWVRDSIHNQSVAVNAVGASAANLTKVIDTVNGIMDTLQLHDNWLRDSVHNQSAAVIAVTATAANLTKAIDSINAILDTLQLYDNWVRDSVHNQSAAVIAVTATAANLTKAIDSVNAILDTLQLYDNWVKDSLHNQSVATIASLKDSSIYTAAYKHMISLHADSGAAGGTGLDSATTSRILKRVLYGIATGSGSDSTTLAQRLVSGGSVSLPDSLLKTIHKIYALYAKEMGDTLVKIKFISPYGDRSDPTTFKGAYTSPNYITAADSNTIFIVGDGKYDTVHVNILARNITIIGNGAGRTIFRNDSIAYGTAQKDAINVYKPNFYVKGIDFWGFKFSNGDEDSLATHGIRNPWPNPITVYGTAHNFTADGCTFRQCYKGIVTIDSIEAGKCDTARSPLNGKIINNTIRDGQMFGADVNFNGLDFSGNRIIGIASNIDNGAAGLQLFTGSRNAIVTNNFFDSVGIAVACQNDTNTLITHNNYGYFFPYGARIANGSSVNCTVDEPSLYPAPVLKPEMVNLVSDPSLEKWYADKTLQTKQTDFTGPYLSRTLPGDTAYPDARIVTSKFHTGSASWYANCLYRSNPATNAQQATFGYDTTYALYLDTGLYMASAWVWAVNNSITSIKIRDFGQVDSTYDVTTWSDAVDSQWVQVRSYFRHTRTGKVKVQWITHHNSTCFWDDFFFGKIDGARAVAVFDSLQNPYSTLRGGGIATVDTNQMYHQNAKVIHDSLAVIRMAQVAMDSSNGSDYMDATVDYRSMIKRKNGIATASTQWLSDSTLNELVKEGVIEVSNVVGPYVGTKNVYTQYKQMTYPLDSLVLRVIDVSWKKGDSIKSLIPKPMNDWASINRKFCEGYTDYEARPDVYWRVGSSLNVYPAPYIEAETLLVTARLRIPNITAGSSLTLIPQNYRVAILKYATWQAALIKQSPLAGEFEKQYLESVAVLKNTVESDTEMRIGAATPSK